MANSDGLDRMNKILSELGNPEKDFKVFHIAGTNGKGSTAIMIAAILERAGYSVGLYTSPHIEEVYERMQIRSGGEHRMISADKYAEFEKRIDALTDALSGYGDVHFFEKLTAIAYMYFEEEKPDFVVLECGLGGEFDSTNTIEKPLVSAICQIGMDHTDVLGNTIFKIAAAKAGIIKPGVPVVSQTPDLMIKNVIRRVAGENGSEVIDVSFKTDEYAGYHIGMKGEHQVANAATAVEAIKAAGVEVSDEAISEGLASAFNPGRFEMIEHEGKTWVLDGAHNPDAIDAVTDTYSAWARSNKIKRTLVIFGCLKDKNYRRMIPVMTEKLKGATYATVDIDDERAAGSVEIGELLAECGKSVVCCESAEEAYEYANNSDKQAILIIGSIYLIGEMRSYLKK